MEKDIKKFSLKKKKMLSIESYRSNQYSPKEVHVVFISIRLIKHMQPEMSEKNKHIFQPGK